MKKIYKKYIFKFLFACFYLTSVVIMHHFGITCIYKHFLGFECPGCGITRASISLLRGHLSDAISYNPMVFSVPFFIIYYITDGKLFGKTIDLWVITLILLGFFVNWIFKLV